MKIKAFISRHKELIQKVLAFLIALSILGSCVLISFLIPPIKVKAVEGSLYDAYLDSLPGTIANGAMSPSDGVSLGIQLGLQQAYETMIQTGDMRSAGTVVTFTGKYYHNSEPHIAYAYNYSNYSAISGGVDLCTSDEFTVRAIMTPVSAFQFLSFTGYSGNPKSGLSFGGRSRGGNITITITDSGGSSIFPTNYENNTYYSYDTWCNCHSTFSSSTIPVLSDNSTLNTYFVGDVPSGNVIAGWQNYSPMKYISDIPGANEFTFTSDNYLDFILEVYNPWIEENYPDLVVYLFDPSEDPTEATEDGCNCNHTIIVEPTINVEVNVEPTVNVYVDNDVELPSEWIQDYTTPEFPVETIPWPTQDASESPPVELPTIDSEEYQRQYGNGVEFWFYVATTFIDEMHLPLIVAFAFALSVAGFVLWHLGGGGL